MKNTYTDLNSIGQNLELEFRETSFLINIGHQCTSFEPTNVNSLNIFLASYNEPNAKSTVLVPSTLHSRPIYLTIKKKDHEAIHIRMMSQTLFL